MIMATSPKLIKKAVSVVSLNCMFISMKEYKQKKQIKLYKNLAFNVFLFSMKHSKVVVINFLAWKSLES